jgi:hypothetical protein
VTPEVDLVKLCALLLRQPPSGSKVKDAEGRQPGLVGGMVEQRLDGVERHVLVGLGELEQVPHPQPESLFVGSEAAP